MITFTLRLPDNINELLIKSAKKRGVSKNALIAFVLRSFLLAEQNRRNCQDNVWLAMKESNSD